MTIQLKQLSASVVFSAITSLAYGQSLPPSDAGQACCPAR